MAGLMECVKVILHPYFVQLKTGMLKNRDMELASFSIILPLME